MKDFKINVDREKLSSEHIQSKQNFELVLEKVRLSQSAVWKTLWFYGVVGLTGIAAFVGYRFYQSENHIHETINTQNNIVELREVTHEIAASQLAIANINIKHESSRETIIPEKKELKKTENIALPEKNKIVDDKEMKPVKPEHIAVPESTAQPVKKQSVLAVKNSLPSISGVYNGDISWEDFKEGILVVDDLIVKQFSIQYTSRIGDKTISVEGDKIPQEVVSELENLGLNQTIFVTNVVAGNEKGELLRCFSMDLNLKFKY